MVDDSSLMKFYKVCHLPCPPFFHLKPHAKTFFSKRTSIVGFVPFCFVLFLLYFFHYTQLFLLKLKKNALSKTGGRQRIPTQLLWVWLWPVFSERLSPLQLSSGHQWWSSTLRLSASQFAVCAAGQPPGGMVRQSVAGRNRGE